MLRLVAGMEVIDYAKIWWGKGKKSRVELCAEIAVKLDVSTIIQLNLSFPAHRSALQNVALPKTCHP